MEAEVVNFKIVEAEVAVFQIVVLEAEAVKNLSLPHLCLGSYEIQILEIKTFQLSPSPALWFGLFGSCKQNQLALCKRFNQIFSCKSMKLANCDFVNQIKKSVECT